MPRGASAGHQAGGLQIHRCSHLCSYAPDPLYFSTAVLLPGSRRHRWILSQRVPGSPLGVGQAPSPGEPWAAGLEAALRVRFAACGAAQGGAQCSLLPASLGSREVLTLQHLGGDAGSGSPLSNKGKAQSAGWDTGQQLRPAVSCKSMACFQRSSFSSLGCLQIGFS